MQIDDHSPVQTLEEQADLILEQQGLRKEVTPDFARRDVTLEAQADILEANSRNWKERSRRKITVSVTIDM